MKLKEVAYLLGRKPKAREYGFEVRTTDLGSYGMVPYAQWLHPKAYRCAVTANEVDEHRRYVQPGDFCIDVGAHSGDTSLPLGIAAGPEGCVLALEPNRYVYPTLAENARLNTSRANIVPMMAAATQEPGQYQFSYGDPGFCNGGNGGNLSWLHRRRMLTLDVEGVNLNDLIHRDHADRIERLRFVKTDTEGHDLEVLQSIAGLIERTRPYVHCEVFKHSPAEDRKALYEHLVTIGYDVRIIRSAESFDGDPATLKDVCQIDHCDLFAVPKEAAAQQAA